jgi:hypothetical protein
MSTLTYVWANSVIIKYAIILNIIHNIFNIPVVQSLVLFCLLTIIFVSPFSIYIFRLPIWYFQTFSGYCDFCIQNGDRVVIIYHGCHTLCRRLISIGSTFNIFLSVMLDNLSCSFTSLHFLTNLITPRFILIISYYIK